MTRYPPLIRCQQCEEPRNSFVYVKNEEGREQVVLHHYDCPVAVAENKKRSDFLANLNAVLDAIEAGRRRE